MGHNYKKPVLTAALLMTAHSSFASHIGGISPEGVVMIFSILILILVSTFASYVTAGINIRRKSSTRRAWSIIFSLPITISGLIAITVAPGIGLIILASTIPIWIMVYKSLSEHVVEE